MFPDTTRYEQPVEETPSFTCIGIAKIQGEPVLVISTMNGRAVQFQHYLDPKKQTTAMAEAKKQLLQILSEVLS